MDEFRLHSPPMLVDKTNFGLVLYNQTNFYQFEETSSYWSVKRISFFLCFSLVNQRHTSGITVYNRTVTNIENTVWAVHSCNSWFYFFFNSFSVISERWAGDNERLCAMEPCLRLKPRMARSAGQRSTH